MSAGYLRVVGVCQAFMCIESMTVGALSGLGKTRLCSIISIVLTGARILYARLLCRTSLGLTGIWWALSISAIAEEKPEEAAPAESAPTDTRRPDDDTVRLKWKELAGQYASKPRLASMLSSGQINLREDSGVKVVEFMVMNEAQKQWVEDKMQRELETKLRDLLSCRKVNIVVTVSPVQEDTEKKPYMPEEKAKDLMEKNPEVRAFVADMGLDTK